ncbi:MAG: DinB family protein [Bacteroidota bacterium]
MNEILVNLNNYNYKVNADFIAFLKEQQPTNERITLLMAHIVNAQQVWLERMSGKSMTVKPFDPRSLEDLIPQNQSNFEVTDEILNNRDLKESIRYVNTKRQKFENTLEQMFLHLFNHSSYHRGQINQLLVHEGKPAMVSDYIVYNRTEIFE